MPMFCGIYRFPHQLLNLFLPLRLSGGWRSMISSSCAPGVSLCFAPMRYDRTLCLLSCKAVRASSNFSSSICWALPGFEACPFGPGFVGAFFFFSPGLSTVSVHIFLGHPRPGRGRSNVLRIEPSPCGLVSSLRASAACPARRFPAAPSSAARGEWCGAGEAWPRTVARKPLSFRHVFPCPTRRSRQGFRGPAQGDR